VPVVGAIADAARRHLPLTWDALSQDARFGDVLLQGAVDLVKDRLFGTVIAPTAESSYPRRVIDYAGKLVAIELVEPGIDYWMNESLTVTTTGTNETESWVDRAEKLREVGDRLAWQVRQDERAIMALLGLPVAPRSLPRPAISTDPADVLLTPSPREFPAPFRQGTGTQRLT
jgi:hypothetical protein